MKENQDKKNLQNNIKAIYNLFPKDPDVPTTIIASTLAENGKVE